MSPRSIDDISARDYEELEVRKMKKQLAQGESILAILSLHFLNHVLFSIRLYWEVET